MRDLRGLNRFRARQMELQVYPGPNPDPSLCGCFIIPMNGAVLRVLASGFHGWDHVSVSTPVRTPSWSEMEAVKRLFFRDEETAMQLHVPVAEHVNLHEHCLHLWRPHDVEIPRPPSIMVA